MGAHYRAREAADRKRRVKPRRQGSTKGPHLVVGLIIPAWLVREIAGEDETEKAWEKIQEYEFAPELTDEGILYRPHKHQVIQGW